MADGIGDLESEVWQQHCVRQPIFVDNKLGPRKSFFKVILLRLFSSYDDDLRKRLSPFPSV